MIRWILPVCALLLAAFLFLGRDPAAPTPPAAAPTAPPPEPVAASPGDAPGAAATLVVRVEGLTSARGRVALALYADRDAFQSDTKLRTARLDPTAATWRIEGLPRGTYAVKAYHDRDDDGALDKGAFGAPSEPYGFSNDARGTFGPPGFDAAAFTFDGTSGLVTLRVR